MQAVAGTGLGGPLVHVIDREADALIPYRAWQAAGHSFLVRANGRRVVRWQGEEVSLTQLAGRLASRRCQEVSYQGQRAVQHVAEAEVVLDRPAWRHRGRGKKKTNERVPGPPITLRLVVSRVCDSSRPHPGGVVSADERAGRGRDGDGGVVVLRAVAD